MSVPSAVQPAASASARIGACAAARVEQRPAVGGRARQPAQPSPRRASAAARPAAAALAGAVLARARAAEPQARDVLAVVELADRDLQLRRVGESSSAACPAQRRRRGPAADPSAGTWPRSVRGRVTWNVIDAASGRTSSAQTDSARWTASGCQAMLATAAAPRRPHGWPGRSRRRHPRPAATPSASARPSRSASKNTMSESPSDPVPVTSIPSIASSCRRSIRPRPGTHVANSRVRRVRGCGCPPRPVMAVPSGELRRGDVPSDDTGGPTAPGASGRLTGRTQPRSRRSRRCR